MKNTVYFFFTLILSANLFAQDLVTGFYPPIGSLCIDSNNDTLDCDVQTIQQLQSITQIIGPYAYLNTHYSDTILFYAADDFSIEFNEQELEFQFISAQILSVSVPDGMTYSCNNDDCIFYPNEWGNIIVSGTPLTTGAVHLDIQSQVTLNLTPLGIAADVSINIPYDGSNELLNYALGEDYSVINNIVPDFILIVADSIYGCTDEGAYNYDADAIIDDQSCDYNESYEFSGHEILLEEGWNIIGYSCTDSSGPLTQVLSSILENIIIVKDNIGNVYLPDFGYNGIGDLHGGFGYQMKINQQINNFNICDY